VCGGGGGHEEQFHKNQILNEEKKIIKGTKKYQSQFVLTFKTRCSIRKTLRDEIEKKMQ